MVAAEPEGDTSVDAISNACQQTRLSASESARAHCRTPTPNASILLFQWHDSLPERHLEPELRSFIVALISFSKAHTGRQPNTDCTAEPAEDFACALIKENMLLTNRRSPTMPSPLNNPAKPTDRFTPSNNIEGIVDVERNYAAQ